MRPTDRPDPRRLRNRPPVRRNVESSRPKTQKGNRTLTIGDRVVAELKALRSAHAFERRRMGNQWGNAEDLVVTNADGSAPNPDAFSNLFQALSAQAGLPVIRLHDLRHCYALRSPQEYR